MGKQQKGPVVPPPSFGNSSLAAKLARLAPTVIPASAPPPEPPPATIPDPPPVKPSTADTLDLSRCGKLALHRERKGRGGKTVTLLSGAGLTDATREELARRLRKALGCGATVEEGEIVVMGDLGERIESWLQAQGARNVVR